ncbi:hypothetical protein WJX81_008357 [Elliptochloris bilobata]|uniref:PsbP C-terminal domain-containing protein n=1 Tax=Elliptochloris bilobata TaxID=381761 RepID=A0AAW1RAW7_9CHLO
MFYTAGRRKEGGQEAGPLPSLGDPVQTVAWGGRLPSRRRAALGALAGLGIVLGGNLGGATSALLALDNGGAARRLRADVLFPVGGFRRCLDLQAGYEFVYPAAWLADQTLLFRRAQRLEQRLGLDPPAVRRAPRREVAEPGAAYGPPGGSGEESISVVAAPLAGVRFALSDLGGPAEAGARFLETVVAPPGSGRATELLSAMERRDEEGTLYYVLEYTARATAPGFGKWFRHNLSIYAARGGRLYTLNAQCPQARWPALRAQLQAAADSFLLILPSDGVSTFTGESFDFMGQPGHYYSLINTPGVQVTSRHKAGVGDYTTSLVEAVGLKIGSVEIEISVGDGELLIAKVNNVTLVMPPRKVDTSLKFATSDDSHLVLRWEMFRPRYGNTVELITDTLQVTVWLVPAGTVDRLGYSQPAYLEVDNKLLHEPADDTALQGLVGETYLRVRLLRLPPKTEFNPALYLSPAHFYEMRGFYQSDHFYFLDHAGHRYYLPQRRVAKRRRAKK